MDPDGAACMTRSPPAATARSACRTRPCPSPVTWRVWRAGEGAATRGVLEGADSRGARVGHPYGGAVISEAGTPPGVAALPYIAAFAPDGGKSVNTLIAAPPPGAPVPPILPPR